MALCDNIWIVLTYIQAVQPSAHLSSVDVRCSPPALLGQGLTLPTPAPGPVYLTPTSPGHLLFHLRRSSICPTATAHLGKPGLMRGESERRPHQRYLPLQRCFLCLALMLVQKCILRANVIY